jgi:hypothetical protein
LALDQLGDCSVPADPENRPGAAFAASAALLDLPFSERTLLRMADVERREG